MGGIAMDFRMVVVVVVVPPEVGELCTALVERITGVLSVDL